MLNIDKYGIVNMQIFLKAMEQTSGSMKRLSLIHLVIEGSPPKKSDRSKRLESINTSKMLLKQNP